MAERRRTRRGTQVAEQRRPSDQDEPEVFDEDEPEAYDDEPEAFDEDEPQAAEGDEPEMLDEDEPQAGPDDEPEPSPVRRSSANGKKRRRPSRQSNSAMTATEAAKAALKYIVEFTAKRAEGITGVERTDDGWAVGIEVIEDHRIPSSADILATYETTIAADGELLSYRRVQRYPRGRGDGSKES
jgi:Gas vesicle synthesis protein GvpO